MKTEIFPLRFAALAFSCAVLLASPALRADQTISGNLSVTGNTDIDGSNLTFGTQSSTFGAGLIYNNADTDTLTYQLTRSTASWLWAHNTTVSAMRLNGSHELILYKSDGSTAGVTISPASSTLSLGGSTLYRDGSGVLTTNSGLSVGGAFSATTFVASGGTVTGGSSGLAINAGGSGDQNIVITPTGAGYTEVRSNAFWVRNPAAVSGGTEYARYGLAVNDSTGSFQHPIQIVALAESTPSSGSAPSALVFKTGYNNVPTERLRITSGGDVEVRSNQFLVKNPASITNGTEYARIMIAANDGSSYQHPIWISALAENSPTSGSVPSSLIFKTGYNNVPTERLKLYWSGEVEVKSTDLWVRNHVTPSSGAEYAKVALGVKDSGGSLQSPIQIVAKAEGSIGSGAVNSAMIFKTGYNNVPTAQMLITSTGTVKTAGAILTPAQGDLPMGSFTQGPTPTF